MSLKDRLSKIEPEREAPTGLPAPPSPAKVLYEAEGTTDPFAALRANVAP